VKIGRVLGCVVVVLVIIPVIAAVVTVRFRDPSAPPRLQAHHIDASATACAKPAAIRHPLIGVALDTPNRSLTRFTQAVVRPQIVAQYLPFGDPYNSDLACRIARAGGRLLVQWNPKHVSLRRIAHGGEDKYITKFARGVRAAQVPVVLSFGHEMNGNWYTWGYTKASPREFIAAWRRLHRLFAEAGASNVTWCWNVNTWIPALVGKAHYGISPARRWWPGAQYVDWIGLDAYFATPYDTFHSIFKYPLRALRRIAHKPVLIAETAAAQGPRQARQIRNLFSGIRRTSVIGAVWFESNSSNVRENWLIGGQRAAIAAFRAGARSLTRIHRSP
jgi:glycosyl hydrolase family 26